jgi:cytochrome b involved in lipid metabolism
MDKYYKINEQIINNFEENRRNYQVLYNIKELNNTYLFKDIDEIVSTENISVKIINILDVFHKMNNMFDEISLIYDVKENEEETKIFSEIFVHNNKDICQMVIDDKVYELKEKFNTKD